MDRYDSDSSGLEDEGDFTETGVLLGYSSGEIIDDTISHLGGWPTWLDETTPPPGEYANCKVCNRPMNLLLELHGDLPEHFPTDERRLYIFGCCRKTCNHKPGSIRALRATKKVKEVQPEATKTDDKENTQSQTPKQDLGASLFGAAPLNGSQSENANPFSSQPSSSSQANPFASSTAPAQPQNPSSINNNDFSESFADKVRISEPESEPSTKTQQPEPTGPKTPWPAQSAFPNPYPHRYLDAEYETLSRPSTPTIPENARMEPMDEGGSSSNSGGITDIKDAFESDLDKAFIRFSSRLAQNPEQVLRYEFGGSPLLYSHSDDTGKRLHPPHSPVGTKVTTQTVGGGSRMPRCEYCGSERVFELQLVPHAISVLEEDLGLDPKDDAGMEWGTIILGVCSKDCGPKEVRDTVWREEYAGVQWEETK